MRTTKEQRDECRLAIDADFPLAEPNSPAWCGSVTGGEVLALLDDADALEQAEADAASERERGVRNRRENRLMVHSLKAELAAYRSVDMLACPECGPIDSTDEDGLCHMCGLSVTHDEDGNVLDTAPNQYQRERARKAEAELAAYKAFVEAAHPKNSGGMIALRAELERLKS